MRIHVAIALGLVGGLALGLLASLTGSPVLLKLATGIAPLGTVFVNLLRMVVIPLVAATLFVGVAGLGDLRQLGRLGVLTLGFFAGTTLVSILIGMGVMTVLLPLVSETAKAATAGVSIEAPVIPSVLDFLVNLVPSNPIAAAANGDLLPLVVFTCLFGAAVGVLPREHRDRLTGIGESIVAAMVKLVHWVLMVAPIGVFALAAPVTAESGWALLWSLVVFVIAVLLGLFLFMGAIYLPALVFFSRLSVKQFSTACLEPQLLAFATTSQAATVPAMLKSADTLGLSPTVASFVIALGAAVGRAGSALFQGTSIVFLAWLYGVPMPLGTMGAAVIATGLVSITVAGVPSGSVLTLAPALGTVGIPLDGMAVLLGVDRIPDMFRTATNVTGTMTAAAMLDRTSEIRPSSIRPTD